MDLDSRPTLSEGDSASNPGFSINLLFPGEARLTPFHVPRDLTVAELQEEITSLRPSLRCFLANVDPDQRVTPEATYEVVPAEPAGVVKPVGFILPEQTANITPEKYGPAWCVIHKGMIFRGRCKNPDCPANGRTVYVNKGFGTINVIQTELTLKCPQCQQPAHPADNMGFYGARFHLSGMFAQDKVFDAVGETKEGQYQTYLDSQEVEWSFLTAEVTPVEARLDAGE